MYILFPGRHHLLTNFQSNYLKRIIQGGCDGEMDVDGKPLVRTSIDGIVFAVTSANHSNTRRNPLPFYLRAIALQEFSEDLGVPCYIYGIDDVGHLDDFTSYTLKKIKHDSDGLLDLNPGNTLVLCSTPVLRMYEPFGFKILPAELIEKSTYRLRTENPWQLVEKMANTSDWKVNKDLTEKIHAASLKIWEQYGFESKVRMLFNDKIIGEDGDITSTRDYNSYVRQMDEIAQLKYHETCSYIQPGRIGDIGCAVGSWIKMACLDARFRESDFYGVEAARHLYDICVQRKHNSEFFNPFVFFSQKNAVTDLVFDKESMNTIHTSSLTHEIESYGGREDLLKFLSNRYKELRPGGVWINRDVVGPEDKERDVFLKLNNTDGRSDDYERTMKERDLYTEYLQGLSTYARFLRFVRDYRKSEGYAVPYEKVNIAGEEYVHLKLRDACEFLSKKDYVDNWQSEMHETFSFWSFSDWKRELEKVGFQLRAESNAYVNPWIVKNRYRGKAEIFSMKDGSLETVDYPVTNILIIAQKVS